MIGYKVDSSYLDEIADAGGDNDAKDDARLDCGVISDDGVVVAVATGYNVGVGVVIELKAGVIDDVRDAVAVTGVADVDKSSGVVRLSGVAEADVVAVENDVEAGSPVCAIGMSRIILFLGT